MPSSTAGDHSRAHHLSLNSPANEALSCASVRECLSNASVFEGREQSLTFVPFVLEWPNAQIRLRGRTNFVEFNRSYPEAWSIEVLRIVAEGNTAVSEVRVPHPTVGPYYAVSFLEVEGGRLRVAVSTGSRNATRNRPLSVLAGSSRCDIQAAERVTRVRECSGMSRDAARHAVGSTTLATTQRCLPILRSRMNPSLS